MRLGNIRVVRSLGIAGLAGAAAFWFGFDAESRPTDVKGEATMPGTPAALPQPLASLPGARHWLNTPPLRAEDLRGKVVLVNFWTYSCINSLRPLPYLRAWAEKYRAQGLVVVGVHAPEFGFEKNPANVAQAVAALGVAYPVAFDSDLALWRTFGNQGWPGFYFIGADGRVRHEKLGEGDYVEAERLIQQLLAEAGRPATKAVAEVLGEGTQAAPDWADLRSPETYVGYAQARNFASPGGARHDVSSRYERPSALPFNHWSLAGTWTVGGEFATLAASSGRISYRFHARDLHLVLGASAKGPVRFRVTIDGAVPGADHGTGVDAGGWGTVREDRLYQLVRQTRPIVDRTVEIEFFEPGIRAYAFTFG